jgi:hypothetical protein
MKMIALREASDEVVDFLVDIVKLAEDLFYELLDALLPSSLCHG